MYFTIFSFELQHNARLVIFNAKIRRLVLKEFFLVKIMEENEREILPTEVWCHILTFVNDFDDIMALKITNRFSYQELRTRDPLSTIDKAIKISEGKNEYFIWHFQIKYTYLLTDMRNWFENRCERPNLTPYLYYLPA